MKDGAERLTQGSALAAGRYAMGDRYANELPQGSRAIVGGYLEGDHCTWAAPAAIATGFRAHCLEHGAHASHHTFAAGVRFGLQLATEARRGT